MAWNPFRPRRLAAKLALAVLAAGVLPSGAVGYLLWRDARAETTEAVAETWLVRIARDTAAEIDREVERMRETALSWADEEQTAVDASAAAAGGPAGRFAAQRLASALGRRAERFGDTTFAGVVATDGRILAAASSDRSRPAAALGGRRLDEIFTFAEDRAWIDAALVVGAPPLSSRDRHRSPLADAAVAASEPDPRRGDLGFAAPLRAGGAPEAAPFAALVVIFSFDPVQHVLDQAQRRFTERDADGDGSPPRYPSGYGFLFAEDADLVLAHRDRALIGTSLVRDHGQSSFHAAMSERRSGYHRYEYPPGNAKITGFARCAERAAGGYGWVVGVGVARADVLAESERLRTRLVLSGVAVSGLVLLFAGWFAQRLAEPLRRLLVQTEKLARGHYDARVEVKSRDEIALLADAFNRLGADLQETNRRLVEAEKSAAFKEMARQVAHEIKNPLTPIMLSAQQIERAQRDRHPQFEEILTESVRSIVEQCASLKRIAQNFAAYAAFPQSRKEPRPFARLVAEAVRLYAPDRADGARTALGIRAPDDVRVLADEDELRRVFLNLFNNAREAMGGGGVLTVDASVEGEGEAARAVVRVGDTGRGISEDDRARLFEPYFSTRTGGTGLGLAICRKIVQDHRGEISVTSELGRGSVFAVSLPVYRGEAGSSDDPFGDTRTIPR
jgi:signal transduction histidine kinase